MQSRITTALLIALTFAEIVTAATCQHQRSKGELRTKEAQAEAEIWKSKAGAYAETLEKVEAARKRAAQSSQRYMEAVKATEERRHEARQIVEDMRKDANDCIWIDEHVPDGVRDIITRLYPTAGCD